MRTSCLKFLPRLNDIIEEYPIDRIESARARYDTGWLCLPMVDVVDVVDVIDVVNSIPKMQSYRLNVQTEMDYLCKQECCRVCIL